MTKHRLRPISQFSFRKVSFFKTQKNACLIKKVLSMTFSNELPGGSNYGFFITICYCIVIRNGKIVWKHGPNRPFFLYNLTSENF